MEKRKAAPGSQSKWLWILIAYTGIIFCNSLTPSGISSQQSGSLLETFHELLGAVGNDGGWLTEHIIRKAAHFIEYAGLGCLICMYCRIWGAGGAGRLRTAGELVCFIPFADETIQLFVPGRSGQISDVWLDIGGALFGLAAAALAASWRQTVKRRPGKSDRENGQGDKG